MQETKTRKAAEAKKLATENDAIEKKLNAVTAKIDDGDGNLDEYKPVKFW